MVSVEGISVEFGGTVLLNNISFVINKKDRIALLGKNGAGKSTLLKILAGINKPTRGTVSFPNEVSVGYLPQHMIHEDGKTVMQEAESAFSYLFDLQDEIKRLEREMSERTDYESDSYTRLIEDFTHKTEMLSLSGIDNFRADIEKTLLGLGFLRSDFERLTSEFSGGWRMRIELAKILLKNPDVILLDEPTNHLDIESIQWLEKFLASSGSAVVLVSHDRAFINNVTNRTVEIVLGKIYDYKVGYDKYLVLRQEHIDQQKRAYENQQKMIKDTEDFIERFRYKATKSVQVQSRIKQLDKIDRIEIDEVDNSRLNLKFPPAIRSGKYPLIIERLEKKYGEHVILKDVNLTIERGDKIAFVGKNGEGKSTLVKCILDEISYTGKLKIGHNIKIGYFAQNQASLLDENLTVFETIDNIAVGDIRTKIRDILGSFMFGGEASDKKVKVLSGGERSRLAMIRLLLEPVNFLILDEPTNHLDLPSKDVLKNAIKNFDGTVIVVSHDRDFLDGLVEKVYEFKNRNIHEYLGGISYFLEKKNIDSMRDIEKNVTVKDPFEKKVITNSNISYQQQKEYARKVKSFEKEISNCEKNIERLEKELEEKKLKLSTPEGSSNINLAKSFSETEKSLNEQMTLWEEKSAELERFKKENR